MKKRKKEKNNRMQTTLTLLGPQPRLGDELLKIRSFCPHLWDCGSKGVKDFRKAV